MGKAEPYSTVIRTSGSTDVFHTLVPISITLLSFIFLTQVIIAFQELLPLDDLLVSVHPPPSTCGRPPPPEGAGQRCSRAEPGSGLPAAAQEGKDAWGAAGGDAGQAAGGCSSGGERTTHRIALPCYAMQYDTIRYNMTRLDTI